jgi:hypothetical protein
MPAPSECSAWDLKDLKGERLWTTPKRSAGSLCMILNPPVGRRFYAPSCPLTLLSSFGIFVVLAKVCALITSA